MVMCNLDALVDCRQSTAALSYVAMQLVQFSELNVVERIGIEPMTPCLQSRCSPS